MSRRIPAGSLPAGRVRLGQIQPPVRAPSSLPRLRLPRRRDGEPQTARNPGLHWFHGFARDVCRYPSPPAAYSATFKAWGVPDWFVALAAVTIPLYRTASRLNRVRKAKRLRGGLCPACGYDLRATPGSCPSAATCRRGTGRTHEAAAPVGVQPRGGVGGAVPRRVRGTTRNVPRQRPLPGFGRAAAAAIAWTRSRTTSITSSPSRSADSTAGSPTPHRNGACATWKPGQRSPPSIANTTAPATAPLPPPTNRVWLDGQGQPVRSRSPGAHRRVR